MTEVATVHYVGGARATMRREGNTIHEVYTAASGYVEAEHVWKIRRRERHLSLDDLAKLTWPEAVIVMRGEA